MKKFLIVLCFLIVVACASTNQNVQRINEIVQGMTIAEVISIIGIQDKAIPVEVAGRDLVEDYVYSNCTIRFVNGKVQKIMK